MSRGRGQAAHCTGCSATITNGLTLCGGCRARLLVDLQFWPIYFANLARWEPSPTGPRPVPGWREPGRHGPDHREDRIGRLLDHAYADLVDWMCRLAEDRPHLARVIGRLLTMDEDPSVRLCCALLERRVDTIATLPWAGDLLTAVARDEQALRTETERAIPGWYAGACELCGTLTHVVPGLTWVTCPGCGATTHAPDHLRIMLTEARDWVARPAELAAAVVALAGPEYHEASVERLADRIRKWGQRDRIPALRPAPPTAIPGGHRARGHPTGPRRYRLGDVLDTLATGTPDGPDQPAEHAAGDGADFRSGRAGATVVLFHLGDSMPGILIR